ncbi:hypothetical protein M2271_001804 [Streptomyces sp. LBL]|nr:hypothetical protein [Streptomyces sp. LBL]MDH6624007.1 hypothetical protein [Streptomyces sp. LBL]
MTVPVTLAVADTSVLLAAFKPRYNPWFSIRSSLSGPDIGANRSG